MVDTFKIKRNDTKPVLSATLQYSNGSPVDLSDGSVWFNLAQNNGAYTPVFSGTAVVTGSTLGQVEYQWTGSNTNRSGLFLGEFQVTWGTGSKMTLPSDHSLNVLIYEDYDAA